MKHIRIRYLDVSYNIFGIFPPLANKAEAINTNPWGDSFPSGNRVKNFIDFHAFKRTYLKKT